MMGLGTADPDLRAILQDIFVYSNMQHHKKCFMACMLLSLVQAMLFGLAGNSAYSGAMLAADNDLCFSRSPAPAGGNRKR